MSNSDYRLVNHDGVLENADGAASADESPGIGIDESLLTDEPSESAGIGIDQSLLDDTSSSEGETESSGIGIDQSLLDDTSSNEGESESSGIGIDQSLLTDDESSEAESSGIGIDQSLLADDSPSDSLEGESGSIGIDESLLAYDDIPAVEDDLTEAPAADSGAPGEASEPADSSLAAATEAAESDDITINIGDLTIKDTESEDGENEYTIDISPEAQDQLFLEARTTYNWLKTPVSNDLIEAAWDLAKFGPTAMNCSPLRMRVIHSESAKDKLREAMQEGNKARIGAAPVVLILAASEHFHTQMAKLFPYAEGVEKQLEANPEWRKNMAWDNAWLQAGYLMMALRAVGLSVGPMNGADMAMIEEKFFAHAGFKPFMVINVGFAADPPNDFPRNPRLTFREIAEIL